MINEPTVLSKMSNFSRYKSYFQRLLLRFTAMTTGFYSSISNNYLLLGVGQISSFRINFGCEILPLQWLLINTGQTLASSRPPPTQSVWRSLKGTSSIQLELQIHPNEYKKEFTLHHLLCQTNLP